VIAFEPEGIYAAGRKYYSGDNSLNGLWRLDPISGASSEISNLQAGWIEVQDHGIAWTDGGGTLYHGLTRMDLSSGNQQSWEDLGESGWIWFPGLDSQGNPLVVQFLPGGTDVGGLFAYTAPGVNVLIARASFRQLSITDSHGTWLGGDDGIYLLDANDRLTKVSDVTGGTVAGACN
jgi:hypothetical protein